jgi:hypothetical protein
MTDVEGRTLTLHLPTGPTLVFDTDERTLTVTSRTPVSSQEIRVNLTDSALRSLTSALTEGVRLADEHRDQLRWAMQEKRADEHATRYEREAFMVFTHARPLGDDIPQRMETIIHRRTCLAAPAISEAVTAQDVSDLVRRHAGTVTHLVEFHIGCFMNPDEGTTVTVFDAGMTSSALLHEHLARIEQEHIAQVRAARGRKITSVPNVNGLDDSLDETVVGHDGKYLPTTPDGKRSKVQASAFDTLGDDVPEAMDARLDDSVTLS